MSRSSSSSSERGRGKGRVKKQEACKEEHSLDRDLSPKRTSPTLRKVASIARQRWLNSYLQLGLQCDSPILEAVWLRSPFGQLKQIHDLCFETIGRWASANDVVDGSRPVVYFFTKGKYRFNLTGEDGFAPGQLLYVNFEFDRTVADCLFVPLSFSVGINARAGLFVTGMRPSSLIGDGVYPSVERWLQRCFEISEGH